MEKREREREREIEKGDKVFCLLHLLLLCLCLFICCIIKLAVFFISCNDISVQLHFIAMDCKIYDPSRAWCVFCGIDG